MRQKRPKTITGEILNTGIPTFLETLFTTFADIIDSKMVSALGVTAISAVSVTNQPRLFIYSIFLALNTVTSSLVAKYLGRKDREAANRVFDHVMKLTFILSIVLGAAAALLARPIMIVVSNQPDTLDASVVYFRIIMIGMIFNLLYLTINAALRGCGMTRMTFATSVLSCIVNLFCNYLLIEGHWGFPALGIAGAAIATVIGNVAALILCLCFVWKKTRFINIPYCVKQRYHMRRDSMKEIKTLAKSTVTDNLVMRVSMLLISMIVARIGSFQMAVYSVGMHLMNINYALGNGLQASAVALVGRSYGEGDPAKLKATKDKHLKIGVICAIGIGVLIILTGRFFFTFFSTEAEFVRLGTWSSILIGLITVIQTMKFVYSGCLQGVGAMKEVMKASVVSFAAVNLSTLAFLVLVLHSGLLGVWICTFIAQTVQTAMLRTYLMKNKAFLEA